MQQQQQQPAASCIIVMAGMIGPVFRAAADGYVGCLKGCIVASCAHFVGSYARPPRATAAAPTGAARSEQRLLERL
jgi:hypothetical protein